MATKGDYIIKLDRCVQAGWAAARRGVELQVLGEIVWAGGLLGLLPMVQAALQNRSRAS